MNTTFNELRKIAREKRDAAIKAVRDDYQNALADINRLQRQLIPLKPSLKGQPKPKVSMRVQIMEAVPFVYGGVVKTFRWATLVDN